MQQGIWCSGENKKLSNTSQSLKKGELGRCSLGMVTTRTAPGVREAERSRVEREMQQVREIQGTRAHQS